jgi:hypothetical protein
MIAKISLSLIFISVGSIGLIYVGRRTRSLAEIWKKSVARRSFSLLILITSGVWIVLGVNALCTAFSP